MKMNQTSQNYKKKPWLLGMSNKEYRLWLAKRELNRLCCLLETKKSTKWRAWWLYKKAYYSGITQGRIRREHHILALIYYANLEANGSLELKDLCKKAQVNRRALFRVYTRLKRKMGLRNVIRKPDDLLQKYACVVGASQPEVEKARTLLKQGAFSGLSPSIAAAASLHTAMGLEKVTEKFTSACNVSHTALRGATTRCKRQNAFSCLALSPDYGLFSSHQFVTFYKSQNPFGKTFRTCAGWRLK